MWVPSGDSLGSSRVGYGYKQGSQGTFHALPVLHNDVMALRPGRQHICTDAHVDGQE